LVQTYPENNFELTSDDLDKYVTERTRLVILCSPSNPTGTVWRRKALQELADCAVKKNFMILSDEVYEKLVYDEDYPHIPIASLSPEAAEHTITVRSFSKSHAMTGWRCGYLCCPDWLFAKINALQTHFLANVTTFAQFGALQALQDDGNSCELMRREFARRRDIICVLLSQIPNIEFVRPTGAFYVFVDISKFGIPSADFCYQLMESAHVALAPGCGFGADGFVRISYACSEETLREAVKRFAGFCNGLALKK
jgi:aspartate aminotransferase